MKQTFGQAVQAQRERIGWSIARAADQAGWKWPRWQRIEQDEPKRHDGSPPQLRRETVLKVALAISWAPEDALIAAGYTPNVNQDNSDPNVVRDLTYELTDHEHDELVSSVAGVPPDLRPSVIATIKALTKAVRDGMEPTTLGRGKGARNIVDPATGEKIEQIEE